MFSGYIGEFFPSLDEKGRVNMPVKLREDLGEQFIITKGLDGCLAAYSMEQWEIISQRVAALPLAKARDLKRFMFSSATTVSPDKQGRVLLSLPLREYANIEKELAVIGAFDHVEIWERDIWTSRKQKIDSDDMALVFDDLGF